MMTGAAAADESPSDSPLASARELAAARADTARMARELALLCESPAAGADALRDTAERGRYVLGRLYEAAFAAGFLSSSNR